MGDSKQVFVRRRHLLAAGTAVLVISIVGYGIARSQAQGGFAVAEPEKGAVAGAATIGTDADAAGGAYVQFHAPSIPTTPATPVDLNDPKLKDIAMQLVSSAENSSLDWKSQYAYIEYNVEQNAAENRGYTAGIIGFTSRTGDMLAVVRYYNSIAPGNGLSTYVSALEKVNNTSSTAGLGTAFEQAWRAADKDSLFRKAQDYMRDSIYFDTAVTMAKQDGLQALGQFAYYDAAVMHGPDDWGGGLVNIRATALRKAKTPAQGGNEATWLHAFLDARKAEMLREAGHSDTTRVDTMQRKFLQEGNLTLTLPLQWSVYGDSFTTK